jgi:hypothetical protein
MLRRNKISLTEEEGALTVSLVNGRANAAQVREGQETS